MLIKVLHVFNEFNQGGIEHVVINLMENMDLSKVEFHFAIMSGKHGLLDDKVRKMGGKIHYFSSGKKEIFNIRKNLNEIIEKYGPFNVVHSHVYFSSGYILRIAYKNDIPIRIAHAHDTYKGEKLSVKRRLYESLMKKFINKYATLKFGVSKEACLHVFGKLDNKTFIINNGVNLNKYKFNSNIRKKKRKELNISNNSLVIINVGRFADQKDHSYLLNVFNDLLKIRDNSKLILVGNGTLKEKIILKSKKLNIFSKILFLENRSDVNELLMAADVFVMPSKYEGLPVSLIEAQATGIPCIISDKITQKAVVAPNVVVLSKNNKKTWVQEILKLKEYHHINTIDVMSKAGFNIEKTADFVQKQYMHNNG